MQKTAILLFANSAEEEWRHKRITNGFTLFDALTSHALRQIEKTGLAYFHVTETHQQGHSFGERFTNAIASVFESGFDRIITMGNDSPHLKSEHLLEAAKRLEEGKTVLGPSADGGFYLLGLHKSDFDPRSFQVLPWQTSHLFQCALAYFGGLGQKISTLPTFFDIDVEENIKSILSDIKILGSRLLGVLSRLLVVFRPLAPPIIHFISIPYFNVPHNKGSPFGHSL